ncbi:hypothetical protein ACFOYW_16655 [Gryllotalpicola reticulitermitis]|uniref:Uncharacterized protein n=1 Tax=Gryllotalpicola reticulitermitis TaxID=1184153 RepID=A0ABV8QC34_9MICO
MLVILRAPAVRRGPRSRQVWFATLFGAFGLLCRGTFIPPPTLDALLGSHNWLNLAQNLFATAAFWLAVRGIIGLVRETPQPSYLAGLLITCAAISLPFVFVQKGDHTDGRAFIAMNIGQTPMLIYVIIYTATVGILASELLIAIRRRSSRFYIPFRTGAILVVIASADELAYAILAHWRLSTQDLRGLLYTSFTPLFYPGLIFITIACFLFLGARAWQRRRALELVARLDPEAASRGRHPQGEIVLLYETVVHISDRAVLNTGPQNPALAEAEDLLSHYLALRIPRFRRAITYKPQ